MTRCDRPSIQVKLTTAGLCTPNKRTQSAVGLSDVHQHVILVDQLLTRVFIC